MYGGKKWLGVACGVLLSAGLLVKPAAALEWDIDGYTSGKVGQLTFDAVGADTDILKARGYYTNNSDGTGRFNTGWVQTWNGGGIGVFDNVESSSPQHAVDNNGKDNFLVLEFDNPDYLLTAFKIGWSYPTNPTPSQRPEVELWVGGGDLGAGFSLNRYDLALCGGYCAYEDLGSLGFTKVTVFQDVVVGSWTQVNTDVTGRYAIFAGEYGQYDDYYKLAGIQGDEVIEVPEPGTMAMLATGLVAIGGILRRRRRLTQTAS